jgi:predicted dehydrogenase
MAAALSVVHVGCGGMAAAWLKPAAARPDLRIVGLVDLVPAAAEKRRAEFCPGAEAGTDAAEMIARLRPDLVFNCTLPEAHHAVTLAGLRAGAHVLSEKPLAASLAEARELVAEARRLGRQFAVTQNYRYGAAPRTVREALGASGIGPLTAVHCDFQIGAHFGGFRDAMEHVLLLDMAIHHFDLARFFAGGRAERVFCQEWNPAGSWYRHGANAHALFTFGNGVVFSCRGSWCAEGLNTPWSGVWRFTGEKGSLAWDGDRGIVVETVAKAGGFRSEYARTTVEVAPRPGRDAAHESLIAEFVHCIRNETTPETAAADNLHSLAMVFGAIASAQAGAPVDVTG